MGDYEASTMIDVAPNLVFERLSDLGKLPTYIPWLTSLQPTEVPADAQGAEVRRPHQPVHEDVDVTVGGGHRDGWIELVDEDRTLRWGMDGGHRYGGELVVDFVADGTSKLTVRLHTTEPTGVDEELDRTLTTIKAMLEKEPS